MPVFKNEGNGTWYVMARYVNWKGERKQKCKRGFATKKEAQEWERMFQLQNSSDMDMSFEAFIELYIRDMKSRLKENTWLTKEHIIRTKILLRFHLVEDESCEKEIKQGLEKKLDRMVMRDLYGKFKTAPTEGERERARKEYLDRRGVPESFRW
ncbi:MAG: hypothetical protein EOM34_16995 [Clostridia bacterium]|nr:hypothetical protein [Clostridia bacterium]NCD03610.1 hypothetical protein [Clostridia bacterium]